MARTVWLTFDDGPNPDKTPVVLKCLKANNIKATFFMVGNLAEQHKSTAEAVAAAGHFIGNHTYTHTVVKGLPEARIKEEISKADAPLSKLSTYQKWFRPPTGALDATARRVAASLGFDIYKWNVDTKDYESKDAAVWIPLGISEIKAQANTAVVLNHDIYEATANNLQKFIDEIRKLPNTTFGAPSNLPVINVLPGGAEV
ncbi:polysaccharide deacetylase family protein [Rhizobium laguerreae]|uniref:polysaccharide deacetylase family protein n=1 Tax=Rhizobium laguerreae TaxID=1076926 RepID=UPI001C911651|nr:polysaccharide deacetylase family protein [Rhizobium laguerreae]MBY3101238.1 polysaccharide deacetylase family protein [Rhizobium laguerreae]